MTVPATRTYFLLEAIAVFALNQYAAKLAVAAASAVGLVLPDMPLLRHTYIAFSTILLLMVWLHWRGEALSGFGLIVPRKVLLNLGLGLGLALVQIATDGLIRSVSTPLIVGWTGANPHLDAQIFAAIKGNLSLYLMILPCVWLFAAFGEEFLFRGYLMTRLAQIFGGGRLGWALAIVGQAIVFALEHWYQGPVGMVPIGIGAVLTGVACVAWGRNLWPAIIAHGLVDTLGFTMLYQGVPIS